MEKEKWKNNNKCLLIQTANDPREFAFRKNTQTQENSRIMRRREKRKEHKFLQKNRTKENQVGKQA